MYKRQPQDIERCAFAERLLDFHVCGNLIKRHMARAFYNDLDILVPCLLGKLTPVSYTHLDVYKRQHPYHGAGNQILMRKTGCINRERVIV